MRVDPYYILSCNAGCHSTSSLFPQEYTHRSDVPWVQIQYSLEIPAGKHIPGSLVSVQIDQDPLQTL